MKHVASFAPDSVFGRMSHWCRQDCVIHIIHPLIDDRCSFTCVKNSCSSSIIHSVHRFSVDVISKKVSEQWLCLCVCTLTKYDIAFLCFS
jgi:hypothetical protein